MRALASVSRFKRPLIVAFILVTILALLHSRGSLPNPVDVVRNQIPIISHDDTVITDAPKAPEPHDDTVVADTPITPEPQDDTKVADAPIEAEPPKAAIDEKPLEVDESMKIRQELGKNLVDLFTQYRPPIEAINETWWKSWPHMLPLSPYKKYDYPEVIDASNGFFSEDETDADFYAQQQALKKAIPTWDAMQKGYKGRGIVISAGSVHLKRVWPHVVLMLHELNCTLPIEVWTKDPEEYAITLPMVQQLKTEIKVPLTIHAISDYMHVVWNEFNMPEIFKVKALALVYSSFEEAILFDADSVPVMNPEVVFDSPQAGNGLIQWPDFWSNSVSQVMYDTYVFFNTVIRTCESGQIFINKKKQFEPLVLATYFNWYGDNFFYKLIYLDSMGAGDKDTFWVGSSAFKREFHIVDRPLALISAKKLNGSHWKEPQSIFNGAMGQFNPMNNSEIFTMHMHSPKINMQVDELEGQFDLLFFHADPEQNVTFRHGEAWLERKLWEHLQWIECTSVVKQPETNACEGITKRLGDMPLS